MMRGLSIIKALLLSAIDRVNEAASPWDGFTRPPCVDPSQSYPSIDARLDAIAVSAEEELKGFVVGGFYTQLKETDMGDSTIWQGVYAAMTVYRHRALKTESSALRMREAARALSLCVHPELLIVCRGAMRADLEGSLFHFNPTKTGQYFRSFSPAVGEMVYRDDASLDSFVGLMYGVAVVLSLSDDAICRSYFGHFKAFSDKFAADGYKLTNRDGSPTRYGDCSPKFAQAPVRVLAACLPSLLSGGTQWGVIAGRHSPEFERTETHFLWKQAWFNDHMAMLAGLAYLNAPIQPSTGLKEARRGIRILLDKHAGKGNAFLILAAFAAGVHVSWSEMDTAIQVLSEFPISGKVMSSDLTADDSVPKVTWNGKTQARQPVPNWKRPPADVVWQRCPYDIKGSEDAASHRINRMDFLLAYYLLKETGA